MIHLDTNILIDIVSAEPAQLTQLRAWIKAKVELAASSIAWSEFCNGPHSKQQKDAVYAILNKNIIDFNEEQAEQASRLFHYSGRKRGSHADCMIAAAAMKNNASIATRNVKDFEKFQQYGLKLEAIATI